MREHCNSPNQKLETTNHEPSFWWSDRDSNPGLNYAKVACFRYHYRPTASSILAAPRGFEPRLPVRETSVLPLDDRAGTSGSWFLVPGFWFLSEHCISPNQKLETSNQKLSLFWLRGEGSNLRFLLNRQARYHYATPQKSTFTSGAAVGS